MDAFLIFSGIILLLVGLSGCLIPGIPGPPLAYLSLLCMHFTKQHSFDWLALTIWAVITIIVTVLDYYIPVWGTKKFGGTRYGVWGSTIGLIIAVLILPFLGIIIGPFGLTGILIGPFAGAVIGETVAGQSKERAIKAGIGSFIGFLAGTMMKLTVVFIIGFIFFRELY
ncbi:MAG: DUF456 domain-containing protein [Oscillospiraceae bacterium]|jgi:hypothetical protein